MEALECRYRGRVIGLLYPNSKGQLAYRKYHRPTEADMRRVQMQMNDPSRTIGGSYNNLTNTPVNPLLCACRHD